RLRLIAPDALSPVADLFFSSRRRHTRFSRDWSSDVCSSDLHLEALAGWASARGGADTVARAAAPAAAALPRKRSRRLSIRDLTVSITQWWHISYEPSGLSNDKQENVARN